MNKSLEMPQAIEILQSSPYGILLLDNKKRITWINNTLVKYLGNRLVNLIGHCWDEVSDVTIKSLFINEITSLTDIENHNTIWLKGWHSPVQDGTAYYFMDVTEEQRLEHQCSQLKQDINNKSTRDSITGLLNKKGLMQALDAQITRSRRYNNPLSLIRMDFINFEKSGNKSQILAAIGHFLNDQLRWADMAGRTDNDKFLFILPETQKEAANKLAKKISQQLSRINTDAGNQAANMNIYYGVTSWNKGDDTDKLMKRVEEQVDNARKKSASALTD